MDESKLNTLKSEVIYKTRLTLLELSVLKEGAVRDRYFKLVDQLISDPLFSTKSLNLLTEQEKPALYDLLVDELRHHSDFLKQCLDGDKASS